MTLFLGNLPFWATKDEVNDWFLDRGFVPSRLSIPLDEAERGRGFGFVELDNEYAVQAISEMNGTEFQGRKIVVKEAERQGRTGDKSRPRRR